MKIIAIALVATFAAATALPAFAQQATGAPVQLAQKPDDAKSGKDKGAAKKKDNDRTNKGGAARGDARSDQVQGMNKKGKSQ